MTRRERDARNHSIVCEFRRGVPAAKLAAAYGLTRQAIHKIASKSPFKTSWQSTLPAPTTRGAHLCRTPARTVPAARTTVCRTLDELRSQPAGWLTARSIDSDDDWAGGHLPLLRILVAYQWILLPLGAQAPYRGEWPYSMASRPFWVTQSFQLDHSLLRVGESGPGQPCVSTK